uniref:NADH-ubiquinone oxidoreductase chain 5 n=1 Tax=Plocamiocolax pulvinatus TaxID=35206 RepID=E5Q3G6_9FLOR|nr:NADH dehydrogenase subunit 5 [Plocamiocolax pulvinata]ADR03249.1 NADH dehydrogenase subunit 5 [Plocamiocolax pulvinata]
MYLIILFLPFMGSLITGFGGRFFGYYGSSIISTSCVFLSLCVSILVFFEIGLVGLSCYITLNPWIISGIFNISWGFLFDSLTVSMLIVVTLVSSLVHFYSISYMYEDPHFSRYMSFLCIFTFFMLVLITSDNLIQMFLGWEGVGLSSFLLINFWYTRLAANQSALKALIINRVGDFGLILGILLIFYVFKSCDYLIIFPLIPFTINHYLLFLNVKIHILTLIGIFLFIGAVGKSAQLGLHTWLPDAMEGPTPVSALIHAATMVTAGVFIIIRCSPFLEFSPKVLGILVILGSLTAFFGSLTGVFQNDLKRVIAYSTCSQLGYMIFSCGISCYNVSMFHLANHALFKALLFLCAGSVIHTMSDEQDMRRMGSLIKLLPFSYSLMLIGSLALMGFPFFTGFYSKDFILELAGTFLVSNINFYGAFAYWLGIMSAFFTALYSVRLIFLTFLTNANIYRVLFSTIQEASIFIILPLAILCIGSIFLGYFTQDLFVGVGTDFWKNSIFILPKSIHYIEAEYSFFILKWLPFIFSICGICIASIVNYYIIYSFLYYKINYYFLFLINKKWYFDIIYNRFIIYPLLKFGYVITFKNLDRGFIELIGPFGISKFIHKWSLVIILFQSGKLAHYIFFILLGLCLFLLWFIIDLNLISFYLILLYYI